MSAEEPAAGCTMTDRPERARRYWWLYEDQDLWAPLTADDTDRTDRFGIDGTIATG